MPNTVHGPYAPHNWIAGDAANATRLNNLESQDGVALASFNPDLLTPFVESGIVCTKDGTNANQLDIASGEAYVKMTDGTIARIDVVSDNTHTTVTPSSTYHLYLQPDGSWYWSTSNSPQANSLAICSVTTDGSGNISAVTDLRMLNTNLLSGMAGVVLMPSAAQVLDTHVTATTVQTILTYVVPAGGGYYRLSGHVSMGNSASQTVLFDVSYTDPDTNFAWFAYFVSASELHGSAGSTYLAPMDGTNSLTNGQGHATLPVFLHAKGGTNIIVKYQDPAGTPNDFVTVIIERMA